MNETVMVREIEPTDADAVALLSRQLGYERSAEQITDWIARTKSNETAQIAFVACLSAGIVGWIEVSIERRLQSAPFGIIGGLIVDEGHRSRGIGRLLCQWAEQWTWSQGVDTLRVTSRSTRSGAHRFYVRDGYREIKTSLMFEKHRPAKANRP